MSTQSYKEAVKRLLTMIYDHELSKIPDDFDRQVSSWSGYLQNVLKIDANDLLSCYKRALDYRNENKVSAKFRMQDLQAVVDQDDVFRKYRSAVPIIPCPMCNNTGSYTTYDTSLGREISKPCKH